MTLPSRRKHPEYYKVIEDPIDLSTICRDINKGRYTDVENVDAEILRLFKNVEVCTKIK